MVRLTLASAALLLLGASTSYLPHASAKHADDEPLFGHALIAREHQQPKRLMSREEAACRMNAKREFPGDLAVSLQSRSEAEEAIFLSEKRKRELEEHERRKRAGNLCARTTTKTTSSTAKQTSTKKTSTKKTSTMSISKKSSSTTTKKTSTTSSSKKSSSTTTKKKTTTSSTSKKSTSSSSTHKASSTSKKATTTSSTKHSSATSSTSTSLSSSASPTSTKTSSSSKKSSSTITTSTSTSTSSSKTSSSITKTTTLAVEPTTTGAWSLVDTYEGSTFFDKWNFFSYADPTNGNVAYQSQKAAKAAGLAYINSAGQAVTAVDSTNNYSYGVNRPSVRLQSKASYANGLVLWDITHMPVGCAVWPALWSNGPGTWPNGGEIDLLEGVGDQVWNSVSLHTSDGCKATKEKSSNKFSGTLSRSNCYAYNTPTGGCSITSGTSSVPNYGSGVNSAGGGVYAVRFDVTGITAWFLPRASIPSDVTAGAPTLVSWPTPIARYPATSCDYNTFFGNQTLITTMTLCGDWAGSSSVYGADWSGNGEATCPGNCTARVMTGSNFKDAYFTFNSVKVYQQPTQS